MADESTLFVIPKGAVMTTRAWNGSSGAFTDGANWSPTGAPQTGDVAVVASGEPQIAGGTLNGFTLMVGSATDAPNFDLAASTVFGPGLAFDDAPDGAGYSVNVTGTLTNQGQIGVTNISSFDIFDDSSGPSTFLNAGSIVVENKGYLIINNSTVTNDATIAVSVGANLEVGLGGTATVSNGTGAVSLATGASYEVAGTVIGGAVDFLDSSASDLLLDSASAFGSTINGFRQGNTIDLVAVSTFHNAPTLSFANGTLHVTASGVDVADLHLAGNYTTGNFSTVSLGSDTLIEVACFAEGTRLATPSGWRAIEAIAVGDLVLAGGRPVRARWLGRRRVDCGRHRDPASVWPFRVRAGGVRAGRAAPRPVPLARPRDPGRRRADPGAPPRRRRRDRPGAASRRHLLAH